jgi:outer membrane beta-barrel protein
MNYRPHVIGFLSGSLLVAATLTSSVARADDHGPNYRTNGLDADVAVRARKLLVRHRLEVTPLFEGSINSEYEQNIGGGLKLEYHLGDILSIGALGVASTSIQTSLTNNIVATLPTMDTGVNDKTPSQTQFLDHLNTMPLHGAAYISVTPWYGKLAAFASAFVGFDFYFQAGVSFAQLDSDCPMNVCTDTHPGTTIVVNGVSMPPILNPKYDPPLNSGTQLGLYVGGGIHVFLNDFLALDLTVRDYAFSDNPSGADVLGVDYVGNDPKLGSDDNKFLSHVFFGAGLSLFFPTTIKRTP